MGGKVAHAGKSYCWQHSVLPVLLLPQQGYDGSLFVWIRPAIQHFRRCQCCYSQEIIQCCLGKQIDKQSGKGREREWGPFLC